MVGNTINSSIVHHTPGEMNEKNRAAFEAISCASVSFALFTWGSKTAEMSIWDIAKEGRASALRQMVADGADLCAQDEEGNTPLHVCSLLFTNCLSDRSVFGSTPF